MSATPRFNGKNIFIDDLDLKRAARSYLRFYESHEALPPKDIFCALDHFSKFAGYSSLHALSSYAKNNKNELGKPIFITDNPKSKNMPSSFLWGRHQACQCFLGMNQGDVLAVIGRPGNATNSMGTMLLEMSGGLVLDFAKQNGVESLNQFQKALKSNVSVILVLDHFRHPSAWTRSDLNYTDSKSRVVLMCQDSQEINGVFNSWKKSSQDEMRKIDVIDLENKKFWTIESADVIATV